MEIKVLGTGCAGCKALYATVTQVKGFRQTTDALLNHQRVERMIC